MTFFSKLNKLGFDVKSKLRQSLSPGFTPGQSRYNNKDMSGQVPIIPQKLELPDIPKPIDRFLKYENDDNTKTKWSKVANLILDYTNKKGFDQMVQSARDQEKKRNLSLPRDQSLIKKGGVLVGAFTLSRNQSASKKRETDQDFHGV